MHCRSTAKNVEMLDLTPACWDIVKAAEIEAWADQGSVTYNVLPMDAATFRVWAILMHRQSNTDYEDAMIAASALVHKLTVVTRDTRDFERFNVL
jgi:predicted nucleic acid-binding protein